MPLFGPPNIEKMKTKRDVKGLIKALKHQGSGYPDQQVRRKAIDALAEIGDVRAVEPLIEMLKSGSEWYHAIIALGKLREPRAAEPLLDKLNNAIQESREEFNSYSQLAEALAQLGEARAVEPLVELLNNYDLGRGDRERIADALEKLGWATDDTKRATLAVARMDWKLAAEFGKEALPPLIAALKNSDRDVQKNATLILGQIGDPLAVEPLIEALQKQGDTHVLEDIVRALSHIGDLRAVDPLIEALSQRREYWVKRTIADALAEFGDVRAVEPLLKDAIEGYQYGIAALGKLGDPRAIEPLSAIFKQLDPRMPNLDERMAIVHAFGDIGDPRAVATLLEMIKGDVRVRATAADALEGIGWPTDDRKRAFLAIARGQLQQVVDLGPAAVKALVDFSGIEDDSAFFSGIGNTAILVVKGLEMIFERESSAISGDDLRLILNMSNPSYQIVIPDTCSEVRFEKIDCSHLRQLARQELIRRREEA
ncbi:HEAT repeat domain-containing protein [Aggregatilinea lenta]|uniref:HEAT repeat domain-containing protein n=1 Tax=Aggregatilinea lenta TaxID=913108 RepID=UPI000E5ABB05|nr:HEAT repeat domain-containing protein [Aggregatilinea lenta]